MCSQMKISRGWENWNEKKILKILEIIVYSLNYILISYALSNIAMAMKRSPGFILFFASDCRFVKHIGRRIRKEKASQGAS